MAHSTAKLTLFLIGLVPAWLAPRAGAQALIDEYLGTGNGFGVAVSDAGDVNADGYGDTLVGIPTDNSGGLIRAGSVTVFSGLDGSVLYDSSDFWFRGGAAEDRFGSALACAGRVDGDAHDDLIIAGGTHLSTTRYVRVISGADGSIIYSFIGAASSGFGLSVDGVGDVDCDGSDDFIIGAPYTDGNRGAVQVRSGMTGFTIYPINATLPGSHFGYSVSGGGDADGDGIPDFAVGAPQIGIGGPGYAVAFAGMSGVGIDSWVGSEIDGQFGHAVDLEGDIDGDGLDDLVVASLLEDAPGRPDAGWVRAFSVLADTQIWGWHGPHAAMAFGRSIAVADANDDGYADVIVGAPGDDHAILDAGSVSVFSGYSGAPLYRVHGTLVRELMGFSVSSAGFVNDYPLTNPGNDALEDVAVGAPGGEHMGAVRILTGAPPQLHSVPDGFPVPFAGRFHPLSAEPDPRDGWGWRLRQALSRGD